MTLAYTWRNRGRPIDETATPLIERAAQLEATTRFVDGSRNPSFAASGNPNFRFIDGRYDTAALRRWRRYTDVPLIVVAVGTLPLLLLEFARNDLQASDRRLLDIANVAVLVVFAVDYVVELILAGNKRSYIRHEWTSALIVLAQAVALVPALSAAGVLRVLRAGPAWRAVATIARLLAIGGAARAQGRQLLVRRAAWLALSAAALTWLTAAAAFTVAETGSDHSFFDALWWSAATITTVGYGDVFPLTPVGRVVGMFTMVVGISTFAVVTAKVAELLVTGRQVVMEDRRPTAVTETSDV